MRNQLLLQEVAGLQQQEPRLHRSLSADREAAGDGTTDRPTSKPSRPEVNTSSGTPHGEARNMSTA